MYADTTDSRRIPEEEKPLMNAITPIINAARRMATMFPGYFPDAKHNHYKDFGYPETLTFSQLHSMYERNGFGKAAVEKTIGKTWQDMPQIWETEDPKETATEKDIRERLDDLRFWQNVSEADRRALVGGYAGLILRFADSKTFDQPVDSVSGGLMGLVEVIPAWAGQLEVSEWDQVETSETYGKPKMYSFTEASVGGKGNQSRAFNLHPDRVVIWSKDGTIHCKSLLEAGYNNLIDMEKISGAGGEGFYKNAKSAPVLELDKEAQLESMAQGMGIDISDIADKMDEQVKDFNSGFDSMLLLQGITAKTLNVSLPIPEHFFGTSLMIFSASVDCPQKILTGSQTGERSSTEDASEWARTNMSRRNLIAKPTIMTIIQRLEAVGILPDRDWHIEWTDLTEASATEKMDRAKGMAEINAKLAPAGEAVYLPEEIRAVTHDEPLKGRGRLPNYLSDDEEFENE